MSWTQRQKNWQKEVQDKLESLGHVLKREDGEIDIFGFSFGFCNGPACTLCDAGWCHHCLTKEKLAKLESCPAKKEPTA